MPAAVLGEVMDITNMLNRKAGFQAHQHFNSFSDYQSPAYSIIKSDPMDRSGSPHGSEHSAYSNPGHMNRGYTSPGPMQGPMHLTSNPMQPQMQLPNFPDVSGMSGMGHMGMQQMHQHQPQPQHMQHGSQDPRPSQPPFKAFACSTCQKGFARRSDLARHGK